MSYAHETHFVPVCKRQLNPPTPSIALIRLSTVSTRSAFFAFFGVVAFLAEGVALVHSRHCCVLSSLC
ncbi:hypothetical protein P8452_59788 [Trifolium repens]|nr:hypothetical protein P8452_59788 [Trifolium repens]